LLRAVIGNFLFGLRLIDGTRYKAINRGIEEMFPEAGWFRGVALPSVGRDRVPAILYSQRRTCS
jgi:hypothetical protein